MNSIFNFLYPQNNDQLSLMTKQELEELKHLLNNYLIDMRSTLGFDRKITMGLELEFAFNPPNIDIFKRSIDLEREIKEKCPDLFNCLKQEASFNYGREINTNVLTDSGFVWEYFYKMCNIVSKVANINDRCGSHIHIGTQALGNNPEHWLNFLKLWSTYENIIFRFSYGEHLIHRPIIDDYAKPEAQEFFDTYEKISSENPSVENILSHMSDSKCQAINFKNVRVGNYENMFYKNTIEFRTPNGTLNPIIWQNNINFFVRLLEYSKSPNFDNDLLNARLQTSKLLFNNLYMYSQIYFKVALELCDLIFTTNLDKINFLKQYLKDFKIASNSSDYSNTRKLTKYNRKIA